MGASSVVRSLRAVIVFGVVAAGLIGVGAARASAAKCQSWGGQPPDVGSGANQLEGVAATSACNALAVGYDYNGTADQTLILHWSGSTWRVQSSPNRGGSTNDNELLGVAATSSNNAWAVGLYYNGTADQTLIEHWNGKAWKKQQSPNPGTSADTNVLSGVTATSAKNAWAVGYYFNGTTVRNLVEHWNGRKWTVQSSPSPGHNCSIVAAAAALRGRSIGLSGVAATSSSNAWAVGPRCGTKATQTLIEHWNGKAWKVQRSPNPGGSRNSNALSGVAATSSTNAWAVGNYFKNRKAAGETLVERWNGDAWKVQPSPNVDPSRADNELFGVAATSSANAWAVGSYGAVADPPLVEQWNGKTWKIQSSSNFPDGALLGVAAVSSNDAWGVGDYYDSTSGNDQNLILHCC